MLFDCSSVQYRSLSGRSVVITGGRRATVRAPFGQPPVFCRAGSRFAELFADLRNL